MENLNLNELSLEEVTLELKGSKPTCFECGATVGTFTYTGKEDADGNGLYKCQPCRGGRRDPNAAKSTFPFVAEHIVPGQKIEVQSMRHLRQLENQHGVASHVYNLDSKNLDR